MIARLRHFDLSAATPPSSGPAGRRYVATGWSEPTLRRAKPVESLPPPLFLFLFIPKAPQGRQHLAASPTLASLPPSRPADMGKAIAEAMKIG
jgi:hypothetical protein